MRHPRITALLLRTSLAIAVWLASGNVPARCQQPFAVSAQPSPTGSQGPQARLSVDEIAKNLEAKDRERAAALQQVTSQRVYHMRYHGFAGNYTAEMVVNATYQAPNRKEFTIVSQSGSPFIINHVFKRLLQSEQEFLNDHNRQEDALNTENYTFASAGYDSTPTGGEYVLTISPRKKNKFLYQGKIWVDAKDFAVVRIEAEPIESPSLWIKETKIEHNYMKVDGFWLPSSDHTQSEMRLGGSADLSIEYKDYRVIGATASHGSEDAPTGSR
jgi:hypothetical protein